jgi:predicted Zn-dependent protease with MMP-like domain
MNNAATREVCRALSESRAIAIWCGLIVSSHVAGFALLAANLQLVAVAGTLTFGFFIALCAHVEPEPPRGPKGEIAKMSETDFECLLQSVEHEAEILATGGAVARDAAPSARNDDGFARLVAEAIDDLPAVLREELERHVAVVISDDGDSHGAYGYYGLYTGGTVTYRGWADRIVIFRDTLMRDFGSDPNALRRKVTMVVRHELAHHLGASEIHVTRLGLSDTTGPRSPKPYHGRLRASSRSLCPPATSPARRAPTRGSARSSELASHADARLPLAASRRARTSFERRSAGASRPSSRARPPPAVSDASVAAQVTQRRASSAVDGLLAHDAGRGWLPLYAFCKHQSHELEARPRAGP